uniref:Uncharacterized protein n=1 Tax=Cyprinus carpio TaxID=7962 RepID=A0A8C1NQY3_CYPCA
DSQSPPISLFLSLSLSLSCIRIFDPNQGGRDITEEIMSRSRSGSTPPPPQVMKLRCSTCD